VRYDFSYLTATKSYKQLQKVTNSYKERQTVTNSYKRRHTVTPRLDDSRPDQGAMVEERLFGKGGHLVTNSDKGDEQRQTATKSYKQLQTVTKSDKQLQTETNRDKINIIAIPMTCRII
jgi:hypothetical protein